MPTSFIWRLAPLWSVHIGTATYTSFRSMYRNLSIQRLPIKFPHQRPHLHHWLGHISEETIRKMAQDDLVEGMTLMGSGMPDCSACQKGKQTWQEIPHATHERAGEVLGWVYSDLCGPMETSSIEGCPRNFQILAGLSGVSGKTVRTISTRHGNWLESDACSITILPCYCKSECVSEVQQIKIITCLLAWSINNSCSQSIP